ncbi:hypothetical protein L249_8203 [Ophiocordyceps polyrhachis-furcata BCC 54312]|uniref:Uncharacterized protein n=1 Tax=Ophiocordyceps polyrhachis-furcata BCC 54312 TaxID=1330021 RepID=A0A367LHJ7_9HYPO|nr:hypothetical protein L249_8203 [Ophiocordyceps polyrhachis-furcata BCC 54312]
MLFYLIATVYVRCSHPGQDEVNPSLGTTGSSQRHNTGRTSAVLAGPPVRFLHSPLPPSGPPLTPPAPGYISDSDPGPQHVRAETASPDPDTRTMIIIMSFSKMTNLNEAMISIKDDSRDGSKYFAVSGE